jgi:hypothetical protein
MKSQPCRFHIHECLLTEAGCHDVPEPSCGDGNDDTEDICCSMSIPGIDMFSCSCCCAGVIETPEVACAADKAWQRSKDINANKIDLTQTSCMQFGRKVSSGQANAVQTVQRWLGDQMRNGEESGGLSEGITNLEFKLSGMSASSGKITSDSEAVSGSCAENAADAIAQR